MKSKNLEIYYDAEDDTLEIMIGESTSSYYDEIEDDLFEGHDEKTNALTGYKIFNFMKRDGMKNLKKFKIALPANVSIEKD